ncbi:MAG: hypothetical protein ACRCU1_10635 [Alsobacter sp.]
MPDVPALAPPLGGGREATPLMDQQLLPLDGLAALAPALARIRRDREPAAVRAARAAILEALQLALDFTRAAPPPRRTGCNEGLLVYLDMPATRADCRGPGICPVFRCKYNFALRVKDSGAIKVDGGGPGTTLRPAAPASRRKIDRVVDAILAKADEIGSLCALDLAEENHWHDEPRYGRERSIPEVARILGVGDEIVRQIFLEARHTLDIIAARERRAEQRQPAPAPLVQIRRRP